MKSSLETLRPGSLVAGQYRLISLLGEGGFGVVYLARDEKLDREVALKVAHSNEERAKDFLARFRREISLARKLEHPNIVRLYDFGEHEGAPFMVMEYVRGEELAESLGREGGLAVGRIREILLQLLDGLSLAHAQGIVHRDLKPGNLMMSATGLRGDVLKILDFGIAKILDAGAVTTQITLEGGSQLLGTPAYMAPEQLNQKTIGPETDIYAVGLILCELITGRSLLQGSVVSMVAAHISPEPHLLPQQVLDSPFASLVIRAIQKDPRARFVDAKSMYRALAANDGAGEHDSLHLRTGGPPPLSAADTLDAIAPVARKTVEEIESPAPVRQASFVSRVVLVVVLVAAIGVALASFWGSSGQDGAEADPQSAKTPEPKKENQPVALDTKGTGDAKEEVVEEDACAALCSHYEQCGLGGQDCLDLCETIPDAQRSCWIDQPCSALVEPSSLGDRWCVNGPSPEGLDSTLGLVWSERAPESGPCPEVAKRGRVALSSGDYDTGCYLPDGRRHGPWRRWHGHHHRVTSAADFIKDEAQGVWTTWDEAIGTLRSSTSFERGLQEGPSGEWEADGTLLVAGIYLGGQRHGRWITNFRDLQGQLHAVGKCYDQGEVRWTISWEEARWPRFGAPSPSLWPDLYERACQVGEGRVLEEEVAAVAEIPLEAWERGTRWVYRIERRAKEGVLDEDALEDYLVVREVKRVEHSDRGARVMVEERGGPDDDHVRDLIYQIGPRCIELVEGPRSQTMRACLDDEVRERPLGEARVWEQRLVADVVGASAWLSPTYGLSRVVGQDPHGRPATLTLVGVEVHGEALGHSDHQALTCDWDHSYPNRDGVVSFELSGAHGYEALEARQEGEEVVLSLQGRAPLAQRWAGQLGRAKSWLAHDKHAEYLMLRIAREEEMVFLLGRLVNGELEMSEFRYSKAQGGRFIGLLTSGEEGCVVRLRWKEGETSRVQEIHPTEYGLKRGRGTLGMLSID